MVKQNLHAFIAKHTLAVVSTTKPDKTPASAVVGFISNTELELLYDPLNTSRKYKYLLENPHISVVIGWDFEQTLQYEGTAELVTKEDAPALFETYFDTFPEGFERHKRLDNIVYFRVKPKWVRFAEYHTPVVIEEMRF